ncbi:MAG: YlmC/YmxH family sporulation protein [Clostridia bacterium]|nr:YlmC/YmxH family sporulation protein [Clostridia bacterium]
MIETILSLQKKEIISIKDGRRLGYVSDIEFDLENGKITALKIPVPGKGINFFSKNEDITVLWTNIKKIGDDIILVEEDK